MAYPTDFPGPSKFSDVVIVVEQQFQSYAGSGILEQVKARQRKFKFKAPLNQKQTRA